jgi:hypothetical protein
MPARKTTTNPTETYTAAQLPEVLRSKLVAGVVTAALDHAANTRAGDDLTGSPSPVVDILTTTAQEIRDWHDQKPSPDHMNGGAVPPRFGDPS